MKKSYNEQMGMKGFWRFYITNGTPLTKEELAVVRAGGKCERVVGYFETHNIIPTVAREAIAKALSAQIASKAEIAINYQQLGTGTTAPANTDIGLETPSAGTRKVISSLGYSANLLTITCFWAAGEATGSWKEMCTFINGTATSNSGTCFNRIAINVTVGASNALTVDGEVTIT